MVFEDRRSVWVSAFAVLVQSGRDGRQLGARRCNRAGGGSSVADEPRLADLGSRTLGVGPIPGGCEVRTFGSESEAFDGHGEVGGLPSGNGHVRVAA